MKSQSTITGRLFSEHSVLGGVGSEISYLLRKHKEIFVVIGITLTVSLVMSFVFWSVNNHNDQKTAQYAKLYHYAVGSKESCNLVADREQQNNGWVPCTITAVSKDNRYYTATFQGDDQHHEASYTFQNQYVGKP